MSVSLNDKYDPTKRYKAVIDHSGGLLVVIAGPGTGKTFSLLRKIECLLEEKVDPNSIYYLTFVNSIVDAFKDDVRKPKEDGGLGADPESLGINISTLHSLAFKIVKVYSDELKLASHLEVIDLSPKPPSSFSQIFVGDLFEYSKNTGIIANKKSFDQLLKKLSEAWRKNTPSGTECALLERAIASFCKRYSVCPWDQLVLLAIKALTENGLPVWLKGAQHFFIDEYQDFNPAEQRLLQLITEPSDSMIIVGDPDQSIYSGRSASPYGLTALLARNEVKSVNFVYCYRCPRKVVKAANCLLRVIDADGYMEKKLQPCKDEDGKFEITEFKSCKAEIEQIAKVLQNYEASNKSDIIVLLSSKKAVEYYAQKLNEAGANCSVKATDVTTELLSAILRLVVLHSQPFLERVVLSKFPDLDRKYKNRVLPIFLGCDTSLTETLRQGATNQKWQQRLRDSLSSFTDSIDNLISDDPDRVIIGFKDLEFEVSDNVITRLLTNDSDLSTRERINLALKTNNTEFNETASNPTFIEVMTMHSSKGLSKQLVIIPAFDEKLLPGDNKGERLAEMHRLVYVAVTRAKGQVLITFPRTRAKGDPLNYGTKPRISSYADILIPKIDH